MKTKIFFLSCFFLLLLGTTSCKDVLSKEIALNGKSVTFVIEPTKSGNDTTTRSEEVLYDGVLHINIANELENMGMSFDHIKSFLLTMGTLELAVPADYDMNGLIGAKLYFDNQNSLVARADRVQGGVVEFKIINGDLLDKLKNDSLHLILVGVRPSIPINVTLTMNYVATVSLLN